MPTRQEIMTQIQIFKNAKGTLVQDSLVKILEMLCKTVPPVEEGEEEVIPPTP